MYYVLGTSHQLIRWILTVTQWWWSYYDVHFTDDGFKVQRGQVTSSKITELVIELGCESRQTGPSCHYCYVTTPTSMPCQLVGNVCLLGDRYSFIWMILFSPQNSLMSKNYLLHFTDQETLFYLTYIILGHIVCWLLEKVG